MKLLCQCLCEVRSESKGDSDWIDSESALPVLVLGCVVNQACFTVDTNGIGCETALTVPVSRYVVNGACFGVDTNRNSCETALPMLVGSESRLLRS